MTPPALPLPPARFPAVNTRILRAGTELHRTHALSLESTQFNPCLGQPTRFAPFADPAGACVPTLYGATSREAAVFESIFHDIAPDAAFKTVRLDVVQARSVSRISPKRDLLLASLFAPDLKLWGVGRTDLIETPKSTYAQTVLWAAALHRDRADLDGLIWTSRQCDPEQCLVLFGDRVDDRAFEVVEHLDVAANAGLLLEIRDFGKRAGIDLVS